MRASGCASARASAHAGKRADSHVLSEVRASVRAVQVRVLVRRESVRACARACRATTGPGSPWCRETPCGAWLCGRAEDASRELHGHAGDSCEIWDVYFFQKHLSHYGKKIRGQHFVPSREPRSSRRSQEEKEGLGFFLVIVGKEASFFQTYDPLLLYYYYYC